MLKIDNYMSVSSIIENKFDFNDCCILESVIVNSDMSSILSKENDYVAAAK